MTRTTARSPSFGSAAAAVALLVLSACGAAGGENTAPPDEDAQALVFAECMRDNGIDMPDPGPGQQGLTDAFQAIAGDQATVQQAIAACEDLMPQYASEQEHVEGWELDLAECLREQGLDVSDDPFDDAHTGEIDVNEFSAAMEECRQVLVGGGS